MWNPRSCVGEAIPWGTLVASALSVAAFDQVATFHASRSLISVPVRVEERGRPVSGLQLDDFDVLIDGVSVAPMRLEDADTPLDLLLLMDGSGSTESVHEFIAAQTAAIGASLVDGDRVQVLTFGATVQRFPDSSGRDVTLHSQGRTRLNDALAVALIGRPEAGRRRLVVAFTDGVDNYSTTSVERVRELANRAQAALVIVVTDRQSWARSARITARLDVLKSAAQASGGALITAVGDPAAAVAGLITEFRSGYVILLDGTPYDLVRPHRIDVRLRPAELQRASVSARSGFGGGRR